MLGLVVFEPYWKWGGARILKIKIFFALHPQYSIIPYRIILMELACAPWWNWSLLPCSHASIF